MPAFQWVRLKTDHSVFDMSQHSLFENNMSKKNKSRIVVQELLI